MGLMKVWIDQDLCTGDGLCAEIAPAIFDLDDDGLAYVKEADWPSIHGPDGGSSPVLTGSSGQAFVPEHLEEAVREACDECPGECIFLVE